MNTSQLKAYMLNDPFIRKYYGGVVAIDQLPIFPDKPTIFIANCDPISLPGSHWVVLYLDSICEHFDSAAFKPRSGFDTYLTVQGPKYLYNTKRIQSYHSDTCGLFCLFYCYFRCRGHSFLEILNMFSGNLEMNETIVKTFFVATV